MSARTTVPVPSLGQTVTGVMAAWRRLDLSGCHRVPGMRLVGWSIFDGARFDWLDGRLWRIFDADGTSPSRRREASEAEKLLVEDAIAVGAFQIQLEPSPGLTGIRVHAPLGKRVFHQATGRPLPRH